MYSGTPDDLAKYGDADVLVARGMTYEVLKNLFPDKHVIEVHVSSFDIFDALVECRKQNAGKIALCLHNRKFKSMEELEELCGASITIYDTPNEGFHGSRSPSGHGGRRGYFCRCRNHVRNL